MAKGIEWLKKYGKSLGVIVLLFFLVCWNYREYNDYLVESQKQEFLRLAKVVTYGIESQLQGEKISLDEYFDSVPEENIEDPADLEALMRRYMEERTDMRNQILVTDSSGIPFLEMKNPKKLDYYAEDVFALPANAGERTVLARAQRIGEHAYMLPLVKRISEPRDWYLVVFLNMDEIQSYLNKVLDKDERSYVALKTQDGYILSHKNPDQVGMQMLQDRKEQYPDLDLSYLEWLEGIQLSGQEAAYVYDSYWFSETPPAKAKKVASFTPLQLDNEFWVVTLNLDYQTYMAPLQKYMIISILLSGGILAWIGSLVLRLNRAREEQQRMIRENRYLQEMGSAMEQLRQEREQRLHARKLSQIGTMTGKLAHDFRNFLGPVIGCAELLAQNEQLPAEAKQDAEMILEYAEKASDLTKQMSRISRQEKEKISCEYFDIGQAVRSWLDSIRVTLPDNVDFLAEIAEEPVWMYGNPTKMQEVLWNLCSNGAYAMKPKGGELKITVGIRDRAGLPEGIVITGTEDYYLELAVSDTGCGMRKEIQEQIFSNYFTTKPEGEGTGLGLAITYDVITLFGGDIRVESEVGKGSRFRCCLPCRKQPPVL